MWKPRIGGPRETKLLSTLLHVIGDKALDMYNTLTWDLKDDRGQLIPNQEWVLACVLTKFDYQCFPKKDVVNEMYHFLSYKQKSGESIEHFATELKSRVKTCEFADQEDELVMDWLAHGIMDGSLHEKSMRTPDLDLDKCISIYAVQLKLCVGRLRK